MVNEKVNWIPGIINKHIKEIMKKIPWNERSKKEFNTIAIWDSLYRPYKFITMNSLILRRLKSFVVPSLQATPWTVLLWLSSGTAQQYSIIDEM